MTPQELVAAVAEDEALVALVARHHSRSDTFDIGEKLQVSKALVRMVEAPCAKLWLPLRVVLLPFAGLSLKGNIYLMLEAFATY